tara:strand:+ start:418 stop:1011 length:594 start_codon:yes stop_codon:yes gene_type:complete
MELLYFIIASFLVVIVPGPTVSLIIANSLEFGIKAGLLNVLGTQIGVLILIFLLALGFEFISPFVDQIIKTLRILGAIYLIILGMITFNSKINLNNNQSEKYNKRFIFQGLIVILTNPKIFLFLGSFLPQFISLQHSISFQIIYYGLLFILVATIFDSFYALIFGKFRNLIVHKYLKILNLIGSSILVLVGVWLLAN